MASSTSPSAIVGEEDDKGLISDYTTTQVVGGLAYDASTLNENWARLLGTDYLAQRTARASNRAGAHAFLMGNGCRCDDDTTPP